MWYKYYIFTRSYKTHRKLIWWKYLSWSGGKGKKRTHHARYFLIFWWKNLIKKVGTRKLIHRYLVKINETTFGTTILVPRYFTEISELTLPTSHGFATLLGTTPIISLFAWRVVLSTPAAWFILITQAYWTWVYNQLKIGVMSW